jgi:hypothetical protein
MSESDCGAARHNYTHANQQSADTHRTGKIQRDTEQNQNCGDAIKQNPESFDLCCCVHIFV